MVQSAEFEEKTYEKYFGDEIKCQMSDAYSPGQVAEYELGFDEGFFIPWVFRNIWFRDLFPTPWIMYKGVMLSDVDYLPADLSASLPSFRLNLFVQCKRPQFVSGHRALEWKSWNCPYFRYDLLAHQQLALERLHQYSAGRAASIYASPAFWQSKRLFEKRASRQIVQSSNIASVMLMTGHERYTYIAAGNAGVGHSDPEQIKSERLAEIFELGQANDAQSWAMHLEQTASAIRSSIEDSKDARSFETLADVIYTQISSLLFRPSQTLKDLSVIESFCDILNLKFFAA